jgi:hypothetical protein
MGTRSDTMNSFKAIQVLNKLLSVLCRSLPAYLADAKPWARSNDQNLRAALDNLVADQRRYACRVDEAITEQGGRPDPGRFPMNFAAKNDLALGFLVQEIVAYQEQDISILERCAAQLEGISSLHALAEEILGNARGHMDILKEMTNDE